MLASKTVQELLDAFSAPTPTPGGGSAAALAGAVAASLLAMVAAMPKMKNGTPEDRAALDAVHPAILALRAELVGLIDRDAASYDGVVAAYRLPKGTDEEKAARKAAVAAAMRHATDVPLETGRAAMSLLTHGAQVAEHGNPNAASDAIVALQLAMTAASGAFINVETNLAGLSDETYVAATRAEMEKLLAEGAPALGAASKSLGWKGHTPPFGQH
jgi:formiminotetrahydrofolate cyclodeaminase